MILIPIGVSWGGYLLLWYGFSLLKGEGMGMADLVIPARILHATEVMAGWGKASTQPATPPFIDKPGVQPGSKEFEDQLKKEGRDPAKGGLPSKPPIGATPPAGYS